MFWNYSREDRCTSDLILPILNREAFRQRTFTCCAIEKASFLYSGTGQLCSLLLIRMLNIVCFLCETLPQYRATNAEIYSNLRFLRKSDFFSGFCATKPITISNSDLLLNFSQVGYLHSNLRFFSFSCSIPKYFLYNLYWKRRVCHDSMKSIAMQISTAPPISFC